LRKKRLVLFVEIKSRTKIPGLNSKSRIPSPKFQAQYPKAILLNSSNDNFLGFFTLEFEIWDLGFGSSKQGV
jgi:hypothetical protein